MTHNTDASNIFDDEPDLSEVDENQQNEVLETGVEQDIASEPDQDQVENDRVELSEDEKLEGDDVDKDEGEKAPVMVPVAEVQKARGQRNDLRDRVDQMAGQFQQLQQTNFALQNQLAQYQQQEQQQQNVLPDAFEDPNGFNDHIVGGVQRMVDPIQQRMNQTDININNKFSQMNAQIAFGSDVVNEAIDAANAAGIGDELIQNSQDPYRDAVRWHQNQQFMNEIGNDPIAYKKQVEADAKKKALESFRATQAKTGVQQEIPPSIGAATNADKAVGAVTPEGQFTRTFFD